MQKPTTLCAATLKVEDEEQDAHRSRFAPELVQWQSRHCSSCDAARAAQDSQPHNKEVHTAFTATLTTS